MKATAVLLACALSLTACSAGTTPDPVTPSAASGISGLTSWTYEKPDHDTSSHAYAQQPPTYGAHWVPQDDKGNYGWLKCGVYAEPVPNEFALHSEEHGAVWLTYRPGAPAADVAALAALAAKNPAYVLVSPFPGQPGAVMASTWDNQLSVDAATDPRLATFTTTFAGGGQGNEKGADCAGGTSLEQARQAVSAAPKGDDVPLRAPQP